MSPNLSCFTIRSFQPAKDLPGLLRLRAEVEAADQDGNDVSEKTLRAQLKLPGHVARRDRWVAESAENPGQLSGDALVWLPPESQAAQLAISVHPSMRRRGVGTSLLERAAYHARSLGAGRMLLSANAKNAAAMTFLQKNGFCPQGAYTEMRAAGSLRLPAPAWPAGYHVRPYAEIQDIVLLTWAFNQCYANLWGHHLVTEEQMAAWLRQWLPEGLFLAYAPSGQVIGVCRVELSQARSDKNGAPTGYVDAPGLLPSHRRLDLYQALLITAAAWLQNHRVEIIEMESWGDPPDVLAAYQGLGFTVLRQIYVLGKEL